MIDLIKRHIKTECDIFSQVKVNKKRSVRFYNCWKQEFNDMYWYQYIKSKGFLNQYPDLKFAVFAVFGTRRLINFDNSDVRIFLGTENVKRDTCLRYSDHFLSSPKIDIALGYECFDHPRYIRFPLWMDYMFSPELNAEEIRSVCADLRFPKHNVDKKFVSLISSWDGFGISRKSMYDQISKIDFVSCGGKYLHNDDSLLLEYNDNKRAYIKNFEFSICPENDNCYGYVTEKIFEAIQGGCIPIYWGSYNKPEPEVLNQDAIIFWNSNGDNSNAIKLIKELHESPALMKEFLSQPRLVDTAEEYILDTFSTIENKFKSVIELKLKR